MRIVSLVPSWTETLLACGVTVVGRTRFCIHPKDKVSKIPAVGGTKDLNWEKFAKEEPELLLLDREENPKDIFDHSPCETLVTHIRDVADVAPAIRKISERLLSAGELSGAENLLQLAGRWDRVLSAQLTIPLALDWVHPLEETLLAGKLLYVIWREPWMAVGKETFIASVLERAFQRPRAELLWLPEDERANQRYPQFQLEEVPKDTLLLFSTEPYPFHRKRADLAALQRPSALVDGENFSWFGLRSLRFLEAGLPHTAHKSSC